MSTSIYDKFVYSRTGIGAPSTPPVNVGGATTSVGLDDESYLSQVDGGDGEDKPKWLQPGGTTTDERDVAVRPVPQAISDPFGARARMGVAMQPDTLDIPARYQEQDVEREFRSLSPAKRVAVQQRLKNAGLIDEYTDGYLDKDVIGGLEEVMGWANYTGQSWDQALYEIESMEAEARARAREEEGRLAKAKQAFVTPAYVAPDYAELAQAAKSVASQHLDRDLKDYEVKLLADELSGYSRQAYESEVAAQRSEHEAGIRAGETGEDQAAGEVQAVNPMARFKEAFEKRYAGEIQSEKDEDAAQRTKGALDNVGGKIQSMFGGGTRSI